MVQRKDMAYCQPKELRSELYCVILMARLDELQELIEKHDLEKNIYHFTKPVGESRRSSLKY